MFAVLEVMRYAKEGLEKEEPQENGSEDCMGCVEKLLGYQF